MLLRIWNGKQIRHREDGFLSLTDMAHSCGKRYPDWSRLESTKSYLETLSISTNISLLEVLQGGTPHLQGTWGHPRLAMQFAQWCDSELAILVAFWTGSLVTTEKSAITNSDLEALQNKVSREKKTVNGYIYLFGTVCEEGDIYKSGSTFVKIGFSTNPIKRFKTIDEVVPTPMVIIDIFSSCTLVEELNFHRRFADQRIKGEWYSSSIHKEFYEHFPDKTSVIDRDIYTPYRKYNLETPHEEAICNVFGIYW